MTAPGGDILRELDAWLADGLITSEQHARLRARIEAQRAAALPPRADAALGIAHPIAPDAPAAAGTRGERRGAMAVDWLQFVGGLLLGAALVALVAYLVPANSARTNTDTPRALLLFGLGVFAIGVGIAAYMALSRQGRAPGLGDAAMAAGLVPLSISAFGLVDAKLQWLAYLAALAPVAVHVVRRGQGPLAVLAGAAFALITFAASEFGLFSGNAKDPGAYVWLGALLAYGAFMLTTRRETWTTVTLGLYVAPLAGSFARILSDSGIADSRTIELLMGAFLAAILGVGVLLQNRGLVAGAAAGLTIDAVVFAFDLGGPLPALVLLLVLGGLLVWQAEFLRGYFRKRAA
jgi:hypothetical protein